MITGFTLRPSSRTIALLALCALIPAAAACSSSPAADDERPDESVEHEQVEHADHDEAVIDETAADEEHQGHHHGHDDHHGHDHHDHSFDDPEKYAQRWNDPARDEWQQPQAIIEAMEIEEGMAVADIGAGTGYFIPHLAEAVGEEGTVLAVDIEQSMLDYIDDMAEELELDNVETVLATGDGSGLEEASVDRIITVNTWHHIPNRAQYSAHLLERLTDDGSVWVVDFHEDSPVGPPVEHRLAPEVVIDELEAGGFDAEVHQLQLERQYIVVGTTN